MANKPSKSIPKDAVIAHVAKDINISKVLAGKQLESTVSLIQSELASTGVFVLPGIGKFTVTQRAARPGRNPKTGAAVQIPERKVISFKPAKELRDAVG